MKILINLSTLKKGGGQNVALSFLNSLVNNSDIRDDFYFLVAKNTDIHLFLLENKCNNILVTSENPFYRVIFEVLFYSFYIKKKNIDVIYTYFGYALFVTKVPQVIGAVDSNIFYPDIEFWADYHGFDLIRKKIIDAYRLWGVKHSQGIIFENKDLEKQCLKLYNYRLPTTTIKPSISSNYKNENYEHSCFDECAECYKGLFLCGWHRNKNLLIVPRIALELKNKKIKFHFIITAPKDSSKMYDEFMRLCCDLNVENMISIIGTVKKEFLLSLYKKIDIVFLLSKLESFSNNIIESYYFQRPLVVADEPWSRSICNNAAIYVDRNNYVDIANKIRELLVNDDLYNKVVVNGLMELDGYPNVMSKLYQEIDFIKYVAKINKL